MVKRAPTNSKKKSPTNVIRGEGKPGCKRPPTQSERLARKISRMTLHKTKSPKVTGGTRNERKTLQKILDSFEKTSKLQKHQKLLEAIERLTIRP